MPHQCTACGRTFPDGSKEMLSGCPNCGGNKFKFDPSSRGSDAHDAPNDSSSGRTAEAASGRADTSGPDDGGDDRRVPAQSFDDLESDLQFEGDWPSTEPDSNGDDDIIEADEEPVSGSLEEQARKDTRSSFAGPFETGGTSASSAESDVRTDDAAADSASGHDDGAPPAPDGQSSSPAPDGQSSSPAPDGQSSSSDRPQSDVEAADEFPDRSASSSQPASTPGSASDREGHPPSASDPDSGPRSESEDRPGLAELREELNEQFESIRIVSPGQYELNLMELYDREEYIISLREDGRYVIEVPETWRTDG